MDKVRTIVYLTPERREKAQRKADELGITLSGLLSIALNEYLKQDTVVEMAEMMKGMKQQQPLPHGDTAAERGGAPSEDGCSNT